MTSNIEHPYCHKIEHLICEITNQPRGYPCFLCMCSGGKDCLWDEVGEEVVLEGNNAAIWYDHTKGSCNMVAIPKAAHYAYYRYYIQVVSNWSCGTGHVCLPTCVECNIKCQFPGNGVYVGFVAGSNRTGNKQGDE